MSVPVVRFLIGGVQKAGTTALAQYLRAHPQLALPLAKEAHVFDAPGFQDDWDVEAIDRLYRPHFPPDASARMCGDATPIYVFHPGIVARIARYNPAMRWIVLLRHPVERALSHYYMERRRGLETWPLWPALLLEPWRLRRDGDDLAPHSHRRLHSYRARGDYAAQLDVLYAHFPAEQVLLLPSAVLADAPEHCLQDICRFLDVSVPATWPRLQRVFQGDYPRMGRGSPSWRLLRMLMRHELSRMERDYGWSFD